MMTQHMTMVNTAAAGGSIPVQGLYLRHFRGEVDYPDMLAVRAASCQADQIERVDTLDSMAKDFSLLVNCNPALDVLLAEVDGKTVGYCRVWWWDIAEGDRTYHCESYLLPEWRGKGIGPALLEWGESRLRQIAVGHPRHQSRLFQVYTLDTQGWLIDMLQSEGYWPVGHDASMLRLDLDDIPDASMPGGLEVRAVLPEHYRQIWEAAHEAFSDHWGYARAEWPIEMFLEYVKNAPLWRVAWAGNQVAGMVLSFIDEDENARFGRQRGYTENISVRRPWRRRGLARALLAQSLNGLKERGMTEAGLGVHIENLHGAYAFYKSMGYRVTQTWTIYRKAMNEA